MAQLTETPWHVGMRQGHNSNIVYAYNGKDQHSDDPICSVFGLYSHTEIGDQTNQEALAIAHLIAASPCMLKLLKTVRERSVETIKSLVESHAHPRTGLLDTEGFLAVEAEQDFLNEIDAVIAKATT